MNLLRLKELLKEKGVSGKELAERVDVSPQTISNIIQGSNFPKPELLHKLAEELEVDIRDLFNPTRDNHDRPVFVEQNGKYIRIGEINLNRLDEGSVAGSDEKK